MGHPHQKTRCCMKVYVRKLPVQNSGPRLLTPVPKCTDFCTAISGILRYLLSWLFICLQERKVGHHMGMGDEPQVSPIYFSA